MLHQAIDVPPRRTMTFEEWADMEEDEPGELVDGELVEEELANLAHEITVVWLCARFDVWADATGAMVGGSEGKFKVTDKRGRKPDLFVYLKGTPRPGLKDTLFTSPPDIVVEVVSPRPRDVRRDRVQKPDEYAAFRVRHYWLLDPSNRSLEILELAADGRYARALGAEGGRLESIPGCPGLSIDLDALWQRLIDAGADEPRGD
jgi:Uma2 family endonuclease